jgi:hypothetical protein
MNKTLKITLLSSTLLCPCLVDTLHAQGYMVTAQMTSQAVGNGTYDYTILLHNSSSSTASIGTFWFAWVPNVYGYDLLPSSPTVTQSPAGWYDYVGNNSYYYPDGYSINFYNYYGSSLAPGQTDTFAFNSPDSPTTLGHTSPFYGVPALTSYVYDDSGSDPGTQILVSPSAVPEPSTAALLLGAGAAGLLFFRGSSFGLKIQF